MSDGLALPSFEVHAPELRAMARSAMPKLSAKSAILLDFTSGTVLFGKSIHQRLPPASTTKIMTALLTLEQGQLQSQVTISPLAAGQIGTRMGLAAGERLTVGELLYGLLLPSGNDAAMALAQQDAPSVQAFVDRMNAKARELGLADTHFVNPHGLDDPAHLSSANDLARLARYALRSEPLFDEYVSIPHFVIAAGLGHPAFDLTSLNQLLGSYPGADGVKTGTTPAAGEVLVGSATRDGHRLLVVVMASEDRYADARVVLDNGFANDVWLRPDRFFPYALPVVVRDTAEAVLPVWEASQVQAFLDPDQLSASFTLAGREVLKVPLDLPA
ncbi:MAG TPA: D-alanyl-D-alanine carboxypeptidase family protein [Chloroflexota bacterium]|nr:D-alanyl-D-alanine carboxypeptidase family protein [Chloroflexota bacterium]